MRRTPVYLRIGGPITPVVKKLMILNAAVFLLQQASSYFAPGVLERNFGLNHQGLVYEFKVWQVFTYMFLHGGWMHIIFNLFGLWMFAGELEERWGSKLFLRYYCFTGTGAGIMIAMMNYLVTANYGINPLMPYAPTTIGASGAIYGILLAYGLTWPNREVLLYFLFPVKMKYLLIIFGLLEFFGTISSAGGSGGNVSHIGHLGGLLAGFVFMYTTSRHAARKPSRQASKGGFFQAYLKKQRLKRQKKIIDDRIEAKRIIDTLLEKIAREGMKSLTPEEKRKLEWARRNYYPNNTDHIH